MIKVNLRVQASKSDNNVEVSVKSKGSDVEMFVDDDYIKSHLPTTGQSSYGYLGVPPALLNNNFRVSSKLYLSSYAEGSNAHSKISKINAGRDMPVFDEDFYLYLPKRKCELSVEIYSEKRDTPQVLSIPIDASTVGSRDFEKENDDSGRGIADNLGSD
jgi:hypothetical protein